MKARRGTKGNPFEVGELVREKGREGPLGVVRKVSLEDGPRHDRFENHPVLYLVAFPSSEPDWYGARELEAAE